MPLAIEEMINREQDASTDRQQRNSSSKGRVAEHRVEMATHPQLSRDAASSEAKQGIVEMPGMVAWGDNWAEHSFPVVL